MDDNKYLQLSISAFITALVIGLGWIVDILADKFLVCLKLTLLGISILIGFFFLYKYRIYNSKAEGWEWVNNLVEKVYEVIPNIAMVPLIIVGVIIVTINTSDPSTQSPTTQSPTPKPKSCNTCCATPAPTATCPPTPTFTLTSTPTITPSPTPTNTSTPPPTITPTPREITGCVIIHGLNVRNSPGVKESPSNFAKMWLTNGACLTILDTSTPEWARVRIDGWVRLKIEETEYVVTVTPTMTP